MTNDDYREANKGLSWMLAWGLIILILAGLVAIGIWLFGVVTAEPRGQGDAIQKKYSAENWTAAQARFQDEYQDIKATDAKIAVQTQAVKDDPSLTNKQTLAGTKSYCLTVVGNYNADANKYLARDFRDAGLPAEIDTTDPSTDCK